MISIENPEEIWSTTLSTFRRRGLILALLTGVFDCASGSRAAITGGLGFSTTTGGREIPALELGLNPTDNWVVWTMLSGARTESYYASGYQLSILRTRNWADFWFGSIEVGFGLGSYYGEKGVYTKVAANGDLSEMNKREDKLIGPAYRVAFVPVKHTHVAIEYLMGIGPYPFLNLWKDVGLMSLGFDL